MTKILITGGMGFIFSHVTEYFIKKGFEVHVVDNLSAGSHPELIPEFKKLGPGTFFFHEYDASFAQMVPIITTMNPEYIIHAAAISDVDYSIKQPTKTILSNNNATMHIFEGARQCKNLRKLLYVSTDEVYGECEHPKREEEIIFPKNPYSLSKAFGSILRLAFDNTYRELRDKTVETRFCNVFGPRQDDRKVIPAIKRAMNGGSPLVVHNEGTGYRQFIHVSEIPRIMDMLLERGNRTYNVTTGEGYTVNELIEMAQEITGKRVVCITGKRAGMDMRYEMSCDRLREEFSWTPTRTFKESFEEYLTS